MREAKTTIKVDGPTLKLEDLRWLVEQCKAMSPESKVDITRYSDQRDGDYSSISVSGPPIIKPGLNLHGGGNCR